MKAVLLLAFFLAIASLTEAIGSRSVKHLEPVLGAQLQWASENESTRARRSAQNQPHPDTLNLKFKAFEREFEFDLEIVRDIVSDSKVIVYGEDNKIIEEYKPPNTVYRKMLENGWVNLNVHEDGLFHALLNIDGELFTIDPLHLHARDLDSKARRSLSEQSNMVMFKDADLQNEQEMLCGVADVTKRSFEEAAESEVRNVTLHPREKLNRNLLAVQKWTSCYPNDNIPRRFNIGFGADFGYFNVFGSATAVRQSILDILSNSNIIYLTQLNVFLSLGTAVIRSAAGGESWNQNPPCPLDINGALTQFTNWRKVQTSETDGLFQLLTNCYPPPGTVGLAWVGVLCYKQNGAGVNTYSSSTWKTVAHEIGHNFGAQHSFQNGQGRTGGIMDYGDGKLNGEYQFNSQFNKDEVCRQISSSMSQTGTFYVKNCWSSYQPQCGNGILEGDEQCDDTSSCCVNCRYPAGSYCSPGQCCTADCQYAPTTTKCGAAGYCGNGKCLDSPCSQYSNLRFCGVSSSNPCQQTCSINGGTTCNQLSSYSLNGQVADGTVCSNSPYSICQAGRCVSTSTPATPAPTRTPTRAPTTAPTTAPTRAPTTAPPTLAPTRAPTTAPPTTAPTRAPTTAPPTLAPIIPFWATSGWSACSRPCGGGTQTRSVICMDINRKTYPDSSCTGIKPATSQSCNTQSCSYTWVSVQGTCNAPCEQQGTRTDRVYCATRADVYTPVADNLCFGTKPSATQPCTGAPCNTDRTGWSVGPWSPCRPACGRGTSTRTVTCTYGSDFICSWFGPKPITSQPCQGPACVIQWQISQNAWTDCSASCGPGIQSRLLQCFDGTTILSDSQCSALEKPVVETRPCFLQSCGNATGPSWVVTEDWEACDVPCGQQGMQTRIWICADENGDQIDSSNCQGGMPRNINRPCFVPCIEDEASTNATATDTPTDAPQGLSTGGIIGIAVGLVAAALIIAGLAIGYFVYSKKTVYRGKAPTQSTAELTPQSGHGSNPLYNHN